MYLCACHAPRGIAYGRRMTPDVDLAAQFDRIAAQLDRLHALAAECLSLVKARKVSPAGDADAR